MWGSHHIEPASHYIVHSITLISCIIRIVYIMAILAWIMLILCELNEIFILINPIVPRMITIILYTIIIIYADDKRYSMNIIINSMLTITLHYLKYNTLN